ncbi:MAG: hypothetical protein QM734_04855 [Cyclobacteriaceae bacterium]
MLGTVEQSEPVVSILADLNSLDASYRALNIEDKIKNNQADQILKDKNLVDITSTVEKLKKSIVRINFIDLILKDQQLLVFFVLIALI